MSRLAAPSLLLIATSWLSLASGCGILAPSVACSSDEDCAEGETCQQGFCAAGVGDGDGDDAPTDGGADGGTSQGDAGASPGDGDRDVDAGAPIDGGGGYVDGG